MRENGNHSITVAEWQADKHNWDAGVGLPLHYEAHTDKLLEEMQETWEILAILQDDRSSENEKKLALEVMDVMNVGMSILQGLGYDATQILTEVLGQMYTKYPPEEIQRLINEEGMSQPEAMRYQKQKWNGNGIIYQSVIIEA